jgi:predicted transport protein
MRHKNVVGKLINFRGLVYSPVEENGVIFLFSKLTKDLNLYIETIRKGFPDCIAKRYVGNGQWEEVNIEFEFRSSDFKRHGHQRSMESGAKCDMIVCWEHDWLECPKEISVIELKSEYKRYPNEDLEEPDKIAKGSECSLEDHYRDYPESKRLYEELHRLVSRIDKAIWRKVSNTGVSYYCPDRAFLFVVIQKQGLRMELYTGGKRIKGVESVSEGGNYAQKWGKCYIKNDKELKAAKAVIMKSLDLIRVAIKNNENTGWYSEIE